MIKRIVILLGVFLVLFSVTVEAPGGGGGVEGGGSPFADSVLIDDDGGYYTGDTAEEAFQEIGAGTTLDGRYLNLDGSNANTTINIGSEALTTTGTVTTGTHQFGDSKVRFDRTDSILKLYVNNKLIHQWEDVSVSLVLLSDGSSFILLSDGTSKLKLS